MYNKNQVKQAITEVKNINRTVTKKAFHYSKLEEVRKTLYNCMEINKYLFDPEFHYGFCEYRKSVMCGDTKKIMDNRLNYCLVTILSELNKILAIAA